MKNVLSRWKVTPVARRVRVLRILAVILIALGIGYGLSTLLGYGVGSYESLSPLNQLHWWVAMLVLCISLLPVSFASLAGVVWLVVAIAVTADYWTKNGRIDLRNVRGQIYEAFTGD